MCECGGWLIECVCGDRCCDDCGCRAEVDEANASMRELARELIALALLLVSGVLFFLAWSWPIRDEIGFGLLYVSALIVIGRLDA